VPVFVYWPGGLRCMSLNLVWKSPKGYGETNIELKKKKRKKKKKSRNVK